MIMVLNKEQTKHFLEGSLYTALATSGYTRNEFYDRYISYNISDISGCKMMSLGADISKTFPNYDLITHNCDDVALDILRWGGIILNRNQIAIPNQTYNLNK